MQKPVLLVAIFLTMTITDICFSQTKPVLGIYDSRAIAIVYARSGFFESNMKTLQENMNIAKKDGDSATIKRLTKRGELLQRIMHSQGFGSGSVIEILENVRDSIDIFVKQKNLSGIVSKWELINKSSSIDTLDVTLQLIEFFKPNDSVRNTIKQIMKSKPVRDAFFIED